MLDHRKINGSTVSCSYAAGVCLVGMRYDLLRGIRVCARYADTITNEIAYLSRASKTSDADA